MRILSAVVVGAAALFVGTGGLELFAGHQTVDYEQRLLQQGVGAADATRVGPIMQQEVAPVLRDPSFLQLIQRDPRYSTARSKEEAYQIGQQIGLELSGRGMASLTNEDLIEWNRLRLLLARADPEVCAAMWSGGMSARSMYRALARLSDSDLRLWFRISMRAVKTQLERPTAVPPSVVNDQATADGLAQIADGLGEEDRERFWAAIEGEGTLSAPDACFAMTTLLEGSTRLQEPARSNMLRALATGGSSP